MYAKTCSMKALSLRTSRSDVMDPVDQCWPEYVQKGLIKHAHGKDAEYCNVRCHVVTVVPAKTETPDVSD